MTLSEYLATLDEEQQNLFVARVAEVGAGTVDCYSATLPNWYTDELDRNDVDSLCDWHYHRGPGASSHYHILLLDYQFAYWSDPERRPVQGWLVAASNSNRDWFKPTQKSNGTTEDGPRHVFGSSAFDFETKTRFYPGLKPKEPIDVGG